jgi:peptide-methionine (S)-S-oxide reductase
LKKATFAAGCFWGVEELFRTLNGVYSTDVGYIGGHAKNPTYKEVCYENTMHAEAIEVVYDPKQISFYELIQLFGKIITQQHLIVKGLISELNTGQKFFVLIKISI